MHRKAGAWRDDSRPHAGADGGQCEHKLRENQRRGVALRASLISQARLAVDLGALLVCQG